MCVKAPEFWYKQKTTLPAFILAPTGVLFALGGTVRKAYTKPYKSLLPVICIGNLVAGGSGKTPTALAIGELYKNNNFCFLSRGYGGRLKGPVLVDPALHTAQDVGDEALLLARLAPVIVAANRKAGAQLAEKSNFELIIMDDGLQNPSLEKDLNLIVIDGMTGFGNMHIMPAGPLRTSLKTGLNQADIFILIGEDRHKTGALLPADKPVITASIMPTDDFKIDKEMPYIAFAGIAHPEKFRATLEQSGANIKNFYSFPDHHNFKQKELEKLAHEANAMNCRLITTAKDAARLPVEFKYQSRLDILPVKLVWNDPIQIKKTMLKNIS